jgi:hypothetical protein
VQVGVVQAVGLDIILIKMAVAVAEHLEVAEVAPTAVLVGLEVG